MSTARSVLNLGKQVVTNNQASKLASLANVDVSEIRGQTFSKLSEKLKYLIDPGFFLTRTTCGTVVKTDPATGVDYPVPHATVTGNERNCNFISYFPLDGYWAWHFPLLCTHHVIATTTTDNCGNFCVQVPAFEIEWIRRWRLEHICYDVIFRRPVLIDIIKQVAGPWPPIPEPGPDPVISIDALKPSVIESIAHATGRNLAQQVKLLQANTKLGAPHALSNNLLQSRAFKREVPPPLPAEFHAVLDGKGVIAPGASAVEGIRSAVALKLGQDHSSALIAGFDPKNYIGPFFRCFDLILPEWEAIFDVPDLSFNVEQNINGHPVTIYSGDYFETNWATNPLPHVTLFANALAVSTPDCKQPSGIKCVNVPKIAAAGLYPLDDTTKYDGVVAATPGNIFTPPSNLGDIGYMLLPNKPVSNSDTQFPGFGTQPGYQVSPAQAPFCQNLLFWGCVDVSVNNVPAKYYRFLQSIDQGKNFFPILGQSWYNEAILSSNWIYIQPDSAGWYAVNPKDSSNNVIPRAELLFEHLLLDWQAQPTGQYILQIEVADGSKQHLAYSDYAVIQVDNHYPNATATLLWKYASETSFTRTLDLTGCPVIYRGASPQTIQVKFIVTAQADHLLAASIASNGCGDLTFPPDTNPSFTSKPTYWYSSASNNTTTLEQVYILDASKQEGPYSFSYSAWSRAFNPNGAIGGTGLMPWNINATPIGISRLYSVAVVDQNLP